MGMLPCPILLFSPQCLTLPDLVSPHMIQQVEVQKPSGSHYVSIRSNTLAALEAFDPLPSYVKH